MGILTRQWEQRVCLPVVLISILIVLTATPVLADLGLQGVLDSITLAPNPGQSSVNVATDKISDGLDSYWAITGSGMCVSTIIMELGAFAPDNAFGVYDMANPANKVQIFSGAAAAGAQATISIRVDGRIFLNHADTGVDFAGNAFGYYLDTPNGLFYGDSSLNGDSFDHMLAVQGTNTDTVQILPYGAGLWSSYEYILGWEDILGVGDLDYDDFVVMVESVPQDTTPPSAPTGLAATASNGSVSLDWDDNDEVDLDGYNLYRSETSGSGYGKLNGPLLIDSNYVDNTVTNGTTYYYVVTAVDVYGNESDYSATPTDATPLPLKGIDVSHRQNEETIRQTGHDINWNDVYNAGYRFAFVKATEGEGLTTGDPNAWDDYFEANMRNARSAGLLVGAYHFGLPQFNDPYTEAEWFLKVASPYLKNGYLRPMFDLEDHEPTGTSPSTRNNLTKWILEWMFIVEKNTGAKPILYTNRGYTKYLDSNIEYMGNKIKDYPLWIAHPTCDQTGQPEIWGNWDNWVFWQYWDPEECGVQSVSGISGGVDIDVFNNDEATLNTYILPANKPIPIFFYLCSPADVVVTDPDGLVISKNLNLIPGASYEEIDIDWDGDLEDQVSIPHRKVGEYLIQVISEPNAAPDDSYTLKATSNGQTIVLAKDVQIQDIPVEPYVFESKLNRSDFDTDGDVDFGDYALLALCASRKDCNYPGWCNGTDLNYDGSVELPDLALFVRDWLWEKIASDIDMSGDVDLADFAVFANHWMEQNCVEPNWCSGADLDKSGSVALYDLGKFAEYWLAGL